MKSNSILNEVLEILCPSPENGDSSVTVSMNGAEFTFVPDIPQRAAVWRDSKILVDYSGTVGEVTAAIAPTLAVACTHINKVPIATIFADEIAADVETLKKSLDSRRDLSKENVEEITANFVKESSWSHLLSWLNELSSETLNRLYSLYLTQCVTPWRERRNSFFESSQPEK